MAYRNSNFLDSLFRLNIATAAALTIFVISGLVMLGFMGDVISWLETNTYAPLMAALVALVLAFASSETRDPRWYHPGEIAVVAITMVLMALNAVLPSVSDWVTSNDPYASIGLFVLMLFTSAILAR